MLRVSASISAKKLLQEAPKVWLILLLEYAADFVMVDVALVEDELLPNCIESRIEEVLAAEARDHPAP